MPQIIKRIYCQFFRIRWFIAGIAVTILIESLLTHPALLFYMIRWQLSTPSLAIISVLYLAHRRHQKMKWPSADEWAATIIANAVGSLVFYRVDEWIFLIVKQWKN